MSAALGVNVDSLGMCRPTDVRASGATWARLVARRDPACLASVRRLRMLGISVLAVFARESFEDYAIQSEALDPQLDVILGSLAALWANEIDAAQFCNEPDLDSPSSWTMTPADCGALIEAGATLFRAHNLALPIIGPGLASGQASYARSLPLDLLDGLGLHPYGQRPSPDWPSPSWGFGHVDDLLARYRAVTSLPFWISEFGTDVQPLQAEYVGRMADHLARHPDVQVALHFCLQDAGMVPPFGLLKGPGDPKPAYAAFAAVAKSPPHGGTPMPPTTPYVIGPGFAQYLKDHPEAGKALSSERYFAPDMSVLLAENALLVYSRESNELRAFPSGK